MPKYTKEELAREDIVVKCNNKKQADYIVAWAGEGIDVPYQHESTEMIYFRYYGNFKPDFSEANPNEFPQYIRIDFSEQFPEYEQEVSESSPEPIPTEYAVMTNATENAQAQITAFETAMTELKEKAMRADSRELKRIVKAIKEI